jgi:hypothetical protein
LAQGRAQGNVIPFPIKDVNVLTSWATMQREMFKLHSFWLDHFLLESVPSSNLDYNMR